MSNSTPAKNRAVIIGTAQSWIKAPFDDPTALICALNDAYSMRDRHGRKMPRADEWYDLHPFSEMWFRPKNKTVFNPGEIPEGVYVRPEGHIEWLKEQAKTIPIWLQAEPPEGWPANAQRVPIEAIKQLLKARPDYDAYIASSPAIMLAHLMLRGFTTIEIYGIHLATQAEYIKQRPGFEWLIGRAEERGIQIVLPPECPLLKHSHVYAYEKEPKPPDYDAQKRVAAIAGAYNRLASELVAWPRWRSKSKALAELTRLKVKLADAQQQSRHLRISAGA